MSVENQFELRQLFSDEEDDELNQIGLQFQFDEELNVKNDEIQPKRKFSLLNLDDILVLKQKCDSKLIYGPNSEAENIYNHIYLCLKSDLTWMYEIMVMLQDHHNEDSMDNEFNCNSNCRNEVFNRRQRLMYNIAYLRIIFNENFLN